MPQGKVLTLTRIRDCPPPLFFQILEISAWVVANSAPEKDTFPLSP